MRYTVKKTVALITSQQQYYLIKVKGNQPHLLRIMQQTAAQRRPVGHWQEFEHSRGRQVERVLDLYPASSQAKTQWAGLAWFIHLVRRGSRQGQAYERSSYYICSYTNADAAMLAAAIRGHWGIENRVHWEKDVTLKEDKNG
ncbi:ISAs1 family transposase, partial [Pontibacter sp. BT213]|nr:ISAs1 family transposase [Pontibacter fetidus]